MISARDDVLGRYTGKVFLHAEETANPLSIKVYFVEDGGRWKVLGESAAELKLCARFRLDVLGDAIRLVFLVVVDIFLERNAVAENLDVHARLRRMDGHDDFDTTGCLMGGGKRLASERRVCYALRRNTVAAPEEGVVVEVEQESAEAVAELR